MRTSLYLDAPALRPLRQKPSQAGKLSARDLAYLLAASWQLWSEIINGQQRPGLATLSLVEDFRRAIALSRAYCADRGNFAPDRINHLAERLAETCPIKPFTNAKLISLLYQSYIRDAFAAVEQAKTLDQSPLKILRAICQAANEAFSTAAFLKLF